ncbi:MAG: Clp protease N-terminal domain-containing protein, partial [Crocinitomicaceae bacterium]
MDFNKFTTKSQEVIQNAQQITESNNQQTIEPGHLLLSILLKDKDVIPYLLENLNINLGTLEATTKKIVENYPKVSGGQIYLSNNSQRVLNNALQEAKNFKDEYVSIEILLFALCDSKDSIGNLLKDQKITKSALKNVIMDLRNGHNVTSRNQEGTYKSLEKFANNLNDLAKNGKLDPVISRDDEIRRVLQILT